jgi:hypothetical protein
MIEVKDKTGKRVYVNSFMDSYMNQVADGDDLPPTPPVSIPDGVTDEDIKSWDSTDASEKPSPSDNTMVGQKADDDNDCDGGPYIEEKKKDTPKSDKLEGDGRATKRPQSETKGNWGHHEPIKEQPADRDKDKFKPWKQK